MKLKIRFENKNDNLEVEKHVRDSFWNMSGSGFASTSEYNCFLDGTDSDDENPFFVIMALTWIALQAQKGYFTVPMFLMHVKVKTII